MTLDTEDAVSWIGGRPLGRGGGIFKCDCVDKSGGLVLEKLLTGLFTVTSPLFIIVASKLPVLDCPNMSATGLLTWPGPEYPSVVLGAPNGRDDF